MNPIAKSIITITITTVAVALVGYVFGFAGLFAHSMMEIFYYAGLFGGANLLVLGVQWLMSKRQQIKSVTPVQSVQPQVNNNSGASAGNVTI